jgi:hypothetical protein
MGGSIPLSRRLSAVGTAIGMVAGLVFWCVAANYIAGLTAGAQLNCLVHNQWAPFNLGLRLWEFGSLPAFLLIGGGLTMLLEFGTRRGGRLLSTTICVLLVVLSTWGYVALTA